MSIEQLISPAVPTLRPEDTGDHALALMEEHKLAQLPLVSDETYLGLITENELLDADNTDGSLSDPDHLNFKPAIHSLTHPFEALRIMNQMRLSVLPVIDTEQKYIGCITEGTLLKYVAENSGIENPGGIIVLEVAPRNYTMYEIARICENEDVAILNSQVHGNEQGMLEVTLKVNRTVLGAVAASFERHNYHVIGVYGEETNREDITGKYNLLMNYINM